MWGALGASAFHGVLSLGLSVRYVGVCFIIFT